MGLKFNKTGDTYTWASDVPLDHCQDVRLWENTQHLNMAGTEVCYKLVYDTSYAIWRYQSAACSGTADGALCRG
jgi:hypothetical protein